MKIRIAASIALAAGLAVGMSGCSLIAHNATLEHYAPSDGVEVTADNVALRNIMLIVDESGENLNVVFTAVNNTEAPAQVSMEFSADGAQAAVEFVVEPGLTSFGDLAEGQETLVISLPGVIAGAAVETYFTVNGVGDNNEFVPVLDGTLVDYQHYVLSARDLAPAEDEAAGDKQAAVELQDEALAEGEKAETEKSE